MQLEICLYLSFGDKSAIFLSSSTRSVNYKGLKFAVMSAVDTHMIKFFAHDTNIFSDVSLADFIHVA